MKIIKMSGFIIFAICTLTTSCDKYLDIRSNSALVIPDDLESLQGILDASQWMNVNMCSMGEVSADNYFLMQSTFDTFLDDQKRAYIWENYDEKYSNDWSKAYNTVYNCNLVIDQLSGIARTAENASSRDNVLGSALYFRGVQYMSLLWAYAKAYNSTTAMSDLGIVLRESSDFNQKSVRSSLEECYSRVIDDIEESSRLLPEMAYHVMRPSKISAYGMLARVYLSMREYEKAYIYSDRYLSANSKLIDFNSSNELNVTNSYPFSMFNGETSSYFELTSNTQISASNAMVDTLLLSMYSENDLRTKAYFRTSSNGYSTFVGSYSSGEKLFGGLATDEIYLIRAECLSRMGRVDEALSDLNTLLSTRYQSGTYVPYQIRNSAELLKTILNERRKELIFRGIRWSDIKRLNIEGANITIKRIMDGHEYILPPNDNRYALPIPADIIQLTGIEQNPK